MKHQDKVNGTIIHRPERNQMLFVSHRIDSSFGSLLEYDLSKADNSKP